MKTKNVSYHLNMMLLKCLGCYRVTTNFDKILIYDLVTTEGPTGFITLFVLDFNYKLANIIISPFIQFYLL